MKYNKIANLGKAFEAIVTYTDVHDEFCLLANIFLRKNENEKPTHKACTIHAMRS
jgi:hypothetical protein